MKSFLLMVLGVASAAVFAEPTVESVKVSQLWPFSSRVKVEYVLSGVSGVVNVSPAFFDGETELAAPGFAEDFQGEVYGVSSDGRHAFTFDPQATFGTEKKFLDLRCRLTLSEGAANMTDVLYKVIDLETGNVSDLRRADFYNNLYGSFTTDFASFKGAKSTAPWTTDLEDVFIWTGVNENPVFKDRLLALRYIPAKGKTFVMGTESPDSGAKPAHEVMLTNDYYFSVFPVTQRQYFRIKGNYGNFNTNEESMAAYDGYLPVAAGTPKALRGKIAADSHAFTANTFFDLLNKRTGTRLLCDIPTEARWEYAARAGTTNNIYNNSFDASDGAVGAYPAVVGSTKPNAFGIYDLMGGMEQWTASGWETYADAVQDKDLPLIEPIGGDSLENWASHSATSGCGGSPGGSNRFVNVPARRSRTTGEVTFHIWAIVP